MGHSEALRGAQTPAEPAIDPVVIQTVLVQLKQPAPPRATHRQSFCRMSDFGRTSRQVLDDFLSVPLNHSCLFGPQLGSRSAVMHPPHKINGRATNPFALIGYDNRFFSSSVF